MTPDELAEELVLELESEYTYFASACVDSAMARILDELVLRGLIRVDDKFGELRRDLARRVDEAKTKSRDAKTKLRQTVRRVIRRMLPGDARGDRP